MNWSKEDIEAARWLLYGLIAVGSVIMLLALRS